MQLRRRVGRSVGQRLVLGRRQDIALLPQIVVDVVGHATVALRYAHLFGDYLSLRVRVLVAFLTLSLFGLGGVVFGCQHPFDGQSFGGVITIELQGRIALHTVTADRIGLRIEPVAEMRIVSRKAPVFSRRGLVQDEPQRGIVIRLVRTGVISLPGSEFRRIESRLFAKRIGDFGSGCRSGDERQIADRIGAPHAVVLDERDDIPSCGRSPYLYGLLLPVEPVVIGNGRVVSRARLIDIDTFGRTLLLRYGKRRSLRERDGVGQHFRVIRRVEVLQHDGSDDSIGRCIGFESDNAFRSVRSGRTEVRLIDLRMYRLAQTRCRHRLDRIGRTEGEVVLVASAAGIDRKAGSRDLDPVTGISRLTDGERDRHRTSAERIGEGCRGLAVTVRSPVVRRGGYAQC